MTTRDKVLLGVAAGAGAAMGLRAWIRAGRRITLDGRVVVITGGSTGHGLYLARQAAGQGAHLVIAARDPDELEAAAAELSEGNARDVMAVPTDVRVPQQCRDLVMKALRRHGRIDVLINNAGIIQVGPMEAMTRRDYEEAMATNFWGAWNCIAEALPAMRARRFGRIGNVVSVGGKMPVPHLLPYVASKFALAGLTKGLRIELARDNILVTGIYPSTMRTGGHTHAEIKGPKRAEYTMFALSDTLPLLSTSPDAVAAALLRAICDGDPEVHVGWQSRLRATFDALAPNWSAESMALVAGMLPRARGPEPGSVRGEDVPGTIPALLTRAVPPGARPDPSA